MFGLSRKVAARASRCREAREAYRPDQQGRQEKRPEKKLGPPSQGEQVDNIVANASFSLGSTLRRQNLLTLITVLAYQQC